MRQRFEDNDNESVLIIYEGVSADRPPMSMGGIWQGAATGDNDLVEIVEEVVFAMEITVICVIRSQQRPKRLRVKCFYCRLSRRRVGHRGRLSLSRLIGGPCLHPDFDRC